MTSNNPSDATVSAALLPCPYCAGDAEVRQSITDAAIACNHCGARTGFIYLGADDASNAFRLKELADVWNRRTSAREQPVGDEGLREWQLMAIASVAVRRALEHIPGVSGTTIFEAAEKAAGDVRKALATPDSKEPTHD